MPTDDRDPETFTSLAKSSTLSRFQESLSPHYDPDFIREILSLDVNDLPDAFKSRSFRPFLHAFRLASKPADADRAADAEQLAKLEAKLDEKLSRIAPFCIAGFPELVSHVSTMLSTVKDSSALVADMKQAITVDKRLLESSPGDYSTLYYRSIHLTENIDLLDRVESVSRILPEVAHLFFESKIEKAVSKLMVGVAMAESGPIPKISALDSVCAAILERRERIFDETLDRLMCAVYSGVPLENDAAAFSDAASRAGEVFFRDSYVQEVVRALNILEKPDWLEKVQDSVGTYFDRILHSSITDLLQTLSMEEALGDGEGEIQELSSAEEEKLTEHDKVVIVELKQFLPSRGSPRSTRRILVGLLEIVAGKFLTSLHNHMVLLSFIGKEAVDTSQSIKGMWFQMELKMQELVDVLIGREQKQPTLDSRKKQHTLYASHRLMSGESELFEKEILDGFSFIGAEFFDNLNEPGMHLLDWAHHRENFAESAEPEETDLKDVLKTCFPMFVFSTYNIPEIHGLVIRFASEGSRLVAKFLNESNTAAMEERLTAFARDLVLNLLANKLWYDLRRSADVLAGRPHVLLKVDSTTQRDENSALPPLPVFVGVLIITEEIINICCKVPDFTEPIGGLLGDFISIIEQNIAAALGVVERWTVAGKLLEDKTFVGGMQDTLVSFFKQVETESVTRQSSNVDDKAFDTARYKAIAAAVSAARTEHVKTLNKNELKALVGLIASIYRILGRFADVESGFSFQRTRSGTNPSIVDVILTTEANIGSKSGVFSIQQAQQRHNMLKNTLKEVLGFFASCSQDLEKVAQRGLILLRLEMGARCFISTQSMMAALTSTTPAGGDMNAMMTQIGKDLGSSLASGDRVVKFNLNVGYREYIFLNLDDMMGTFIESAVKEGRRLKRGDYENVRYCLQVVKSLCEKFDLGSTSNTHEILANLESAAAR